MVDRVRGCGYLVTSYRLLPIPSLEFDLNPFSVVLVLPVLVRRGTAPLRFPR